MLNTAERNLFLSAKIPLYEVALLKNITLLYLGIFYVSILHYLKMKVTNSLTIWKVKTTDISHGASCTVKTLFFYILAWKFGSLFCLNEKFPLSLSCPRGYFILNFRSSVDEVTVFWDEVLHTLLEKSVCWMVLIPCLNKIAIGFGMIGLNKIRCILRKHKFSYRVLKTNPLVQI